MKKFLILILICCVQNVFSQCSKGSLQSEDTKTQNTTTTNSVVDDGFLNSTASNDDDKIYNTAGLEIKPDFPGGYDKFLAFVDKNFKYPEGNLNLKGRKIYLTFIVEKDGSLTDIKALRDPGYETGAEAIRVLKKCPKWIPGELKGKKVRVLYSLPIVMK